MINRFHFDQHKGIDKNAGVTWDSWGKSGHGWGVTD